MNQSTSSEPLVHSRIAYLNRHAGEEHTLPEDILMTRPDARDAIVDEMRKGRLAAFFDLDMSASMALALLPPHCTVLVVGDEDQVVYSHDPCPCIALLAVQESVVGPIPGIVLFDRDADLTEFYRAMDLDESPVPADVLLVDCTSEGGLRKIPTLLRDAVRSVDPGFAAWIDEHSVRSPADEFLAGLLAAFDGDSAGAVVTVKDGKVSSIQPIPWPDAVREAREDAAAADDSPTRVEGGAFDE